MQISKKYISKQNRSLSSAPIRSYAALNTPTPKQNIRKNIAELQENKEKTTVKTLEVNPLSPFLNERIESKKSNVVKTRKNLASTQNTDNEKQNNIETMLLSATPVKSTEEPKKTAFQKEISEEKFQLFSNFPKDELKPILKEEVTETAKNRRLSSEAEHIPREQRLALATHKTKSDNVSPWEWTFIMKPASVFTGLLVLFITLGFFFTFGLIVGKGLTPTSLPIQLASLVPSEESSSSNATIPVLKPEELQYAQALRDKAVDEPQLIIPTGQAKIDDNISNQQTGIALNNNSTAIVPYPISGTAQIQNVSATQAKPIELFDYSLRVASFKDEKQADILRAKLEGEGLRTQLKKDATPKSTWYYVNINFRGSAENFQNMRDSLIKYAIKDSIVLSKTPLS